jgi:hypothetical protein
VSEKALSLSDIYNSVLLLIDELKRQGFDKPIIMQFDLLDPVTNEVVSAITNVLAKTVEAGPTGKVKKQLFQKLGIRDITIKSALIQRKNLEDYDRQNSKETGGLPFQNDLDCHSRYYDS